MPFGPDHERWADATGSYLLGAMPDDERDAFEAHLAECDFCREEVAFLRVASDALPAAVPQVAPPPELRSRIMAVVERESELLRAASSDRAEAPPGPARRAAWWRRSALVPRRAGLAFAAVLLLLAGGLGGVLLRGDAGSEAEVYAGTATTPGTDVRLVVEGGQARLDVDGLPRPPRGRVYQVWVKRPGQPPEPTPALFLPASGGSASAGVPASVRDAEAVLVTHERSGGARQPTVDPVLTVPLAAS